MVSHSEGSGGNVLYNLHEIAFCFRGFLLDSLDRGHDHWDTGYTHKTLVKQLFHGIMKLVLVLSEHLHCRVCGIVTGAMQYVLFVFREDSRHFL